MIDLEELRKKNFVRPFSTSLKSVGCGQVSEEHIGKELKLVGWIESIRDHGGVRFIDLADITGKVQLVAKKEQKIDTYRTIEDLVEFSVIRVEGEVRRRPEGTENPKIRSGSVEVFVSKIELLSKPDILPFLPTERKEPSEEIRLKFRYIDLRREKMRRNILVRHLVARKVREFLWMHNFIEIETPFLTKSTPEGARDFLVPSRLQKGKFYALPQSPQLFKQILQVAGYERYFQIVRCFRDEDLRADRQPEFTQVDLEMSFVSEEDIIALVEELLRFVFEEVLSYKLEIPFPRISYDEAMRKYGVDKPDIRIPFEIQDFTQIFSESKLDFIADAIQGGGKVLGFVASGIQPTRSKLVSYEQLAKSMGAGGLMWFVVQGGKVVASPILKFLQDKEKSALALTLNGSDGVIFAVAGRYELARDVTAKIMKNISHDFNKVNTSKFAFLWVVDFPLFSWDEVEQRYVSEHHPFTAPKEEYIGILESDPLRVRARAYDIILNGEEVGGGSIRIHQEDLQRRIFKILNLSETEVEERFGWFIRALRYGAPPHGGIALGFDRLVALMLGEENIREVIPFPKTQSGTCLLSEAPSSVYQKQLDELGIKIKER